MPDLTVFVGTYNRLDTLARCIENLERQDYPLRIVIVDNGSRDAASVAYLERLALDYPVYRLPAIEDTPVLVGDAQAHGGHGMMAVQRNYSEAFRREWGEGDGWFAVCDCDTAPDGPEESIAVYRYLAQEFGVAAGPHLSLNVGENYPLRSFALIVNARVLFRERMLWQDGIPYSQDDIDSTFHLFPASASFNRLRMRTVRVGPPYWTTHTDWLLDALSPTAENLAYVLGSGEASRWAGTWIREWFAAWLRSPEEAFSLVQGAPETEGEYWYSGFIYSWMLQHGHGCEQDLERSRLLLRTSTPEWSPCWEYEQHWDDLVYRNDHSCLGWE